MFDDEVKFYLFCPHNLMLTRCFCHRRSFHAIAKEAGVSASTVQTACRNFVNTGRPSLQLKGSKKRDIPELIHNYITSNDGLNAMRFLSLK